MSQWGHAGVKDNIERSKGRVEIPWLWFGQILEQKIARFKVAQTTNTWSANPTKIKHLEKSALHFV